MTAAQKDANGNFKVNPEAEVAQSQLLQVQRDIISSSLKTAKLSLSVVVRTSRHAATFGELEQAERELANRTQEVLNGFTHMNGAKAVTETIAKRRIFLGRCLEWVTKISVIRTCSRRTSLISSQ